MYLVIYLETMERHNGSFMPCNVKLEWALGPRATGHEAHKKHTYFHIDLKIFYLRTFPWAHIFLLVLISGAPL